MKFLINSEYPINNCAHSETVFIKDRNEIQICVIYSRYVFHNRVYLIIELPISFKTKLRRTICYKLKPFLKLPNK